MSEVLHILLGASFAVAVCVAAGKLLLRRLSLQFARFEDGLIAFVTGSAVVSFVVFLLCATHTARRGVVLWGGLLPVALALWSGWNLRTPIRPAQALSPVPRTWLVLFFVIFSAYFFVYFVNGMAPEVSPDGSGYHLGNVARYWREHGFAWNYHSMYSYLSQGTEMLFLVAYVFGRNSAAALVHLAFQTVLPLLMIFYGRRIGYPKAGIFAAILVYASPVVGLDGSSAYNDLALATVLFAVFFLLEVWDQEKTDNLLIIIGLLSGFCYAIKYTAFLAVPFALGFVLLQTRRHEGRVRWRAALPIVLGAAVSVLPWVLRNWIWLGNPAAPFLNRWFPNAYYHPGMEEIYLRMLRIYTGIQHWWEIPLELTVGGQFVTGLVGPVFLLAPLALLALRRTHGRRLLAAAALFGVAGFLNVGTRFLIPALPFLALAMGIALSNTWGALPALAVFHAVTCWITVVPSYSDKYVWRLDTIPIDAALRREPEADFIRRRMSAIWLKAPLERYLAPNEKVFGFSGVPEAYIARDVVVSYESTLGNLFNDVLWAPLDGYLPNHRSRFVIQPMRAEAVRLVQTGTVDAFWTLAEVRIYAGGRELPRAPEWRLSAWPNPWEVQLAFDDNYATRWSGWQKMERGQFVQIDFGRTQTVDSIVLECAATPNSRLEIQSRLEDGRWITAPAVAEESDRKDPPPGMRRAAALALKVRGVRHILVNDSEFVAPDMKKYPKYWGITLLEQQNGTSLYRID